MKDFICKECSIMKMIIGLLFILSSLNSFAFTDPKVGGVVIISKSDEKKLNPNAVLFVFAKKAGPDSGPTDHSAPIAVIKIDHPKFPQAFVITPKNVMMPGAPFEGPMHIIARYSLNGDAMGTPDSLEGIDPNFPSVDLGNKNLKIILKDKKSK